MRNYLTWFFCFAFLVSCGGGSGSGPGGGSIGSTIPVGVVSGTSFDGLILNGTVSVYDFSTGVKGALLGQTTSDSSGLYSVSLQIESRPVLVEITGGYYNEEAGTNAQVTLDTAPNTKHKLTALANYTTGSSLKVAVTTYSHLAAGLAAYQISQGIAVTTAIDNANTRVSSLTGVNILTTTPKEITDIANVSATLTPELRYGFLAGAISMWTLNHTPPTAAPRSPPYTSIDFAQLLYQDISADGLLDGVGRDSGGNLTYLSFGATPLGVDVYRLGIGTAIVQMAGNKNNKTGVDGAKVLSFAQTYIANTDAIFNSVTPTAFAISSSAIISPASGAWVARTVNVSATAQSPFGIGLVELLVDGTVIASSIAAAGPYPFSIVTTSYTDGTHTVAVRVTDNGGFVTTTPITVGFDNTYPTATSALPWNCAGSCTPLLAVIVAADGGSGVQSVTNLTTGVVATLSGGSYNVRTSSSTPYWDYFQIRDNAGNCSKYNPSANNAYGQYGMAWVLVSQYACP
jgi:hypothetical protein